MRWPPGRPDSRPRLHRSNRPRAEAHCQHQGEPARGRQPRPALQRQPQPEPPLLFYAFVADGVFAADDVGRIPLHGLPPPTVNMLDRIIRRVRDRNLRWLCKHSLLDERSGYDRSNERPEAGALEACAAVARRGDADEHPPRPRGRLLDGELFAVSRRIDWNVLLRRTFGVDSLACPKCAGRMAVLATITDRTAVTKILTCLGLPTSPPPRAAARDPTDGPRTFDEGAAQAGRATARVRTAV